MFCCESQSLHVLEQNDVIFQFKVLNTWSLSGIEYLKSGLFQKIQNVWLPL